MREHLPNHAILWDMDGVIVNTGQFHYVAWKKTFADRGIPFSMDQFRKTFGMNNAGILEYMLRKKPTVDQVMEISDQKELRFREAVQGKAQLLPGVETWLDRFNLSGFMQAIASSAPPENIDMLVDELAIRTYFDAITSGFDLPGKPDPAVFMKAAAEMGVPPERCIVIEDAITGVAGAKRAGMKCIAVTTTNRARDLSDADLVVDLLVQLDEGTFVALMND
ncbi:MAG: HAD family phosphatase [Anaerolineales bacterium]|nr:MAG: HAD family phosphatase [Anaerolineales bacterium]